MSTLFTKIINREIPAQIVYEDDLCIAFKDKEPWAPVHVLIAPKKEIPSLSEVTEDDKNLLGHLMVKAVQVAKNMGVSDSGFRLVANTHSEGGQEIDHIHIHILGGRQMEWPPG